MNKIKNFFKDRTVPFYLLLATSVLSVFVGIFYGAAYSHSVYLNGWAVALPIVGGLLFIALTVVTVFFDKIPFIDKIASVGMWLLDFIGFVVFIQATYLYFSEIFFGVGFAGITAMSPLYAISFVVYILVIVLSNVCMYMRTAYTTSVEQQETQTEETV